MFYEGLRLWGAQVLTSLCGQAGPLKKDLTCAGGRVWKALGGVFVHAARRPADPVYFYPCFSLRRLVPAPRSSPRDLFLRAFWRIAPIGASNRRRVVLSRNDDLIPNSKSYSELVILPRNDDLIPKAM